MTERTQKTIFDWALEYHNKGLCIIPIRDGTKKPAVKWQQYQKDRPTEAKLAEWFGNGKYTNLAVVCGAVSGNLAVLDLDSEQRCQWWTNAHPELAKTLPTVKTNKGLHIYFQAQPFRKKNGNEMDLLCEGAYVILPPSKDKSWVISLNGELPLIDPFTLGLEQFGINRSELPFASNKDFTEETEDTEDIEDIEEIEEIEAIRVKVVNFKELEKDIKSKVLTAISATKPSMNGYRNKLVFQYCRWLKGIEMFANMAAKQVKSLCREWHSAALPNIGTKPFDETWADFACGWNRVKYPKGDGMLKEALQKALEAKNRLSAENDYDTEEVQLLVRVCYELQRLQGKKPFWLSCYSAGNILGVSHTQANQYLQMIEADDIIKCVQQNTTNLAKRYKFLGN